MKKYYPNIWDCRYRISAKAIIKNSQWKIALALKEMMIAWEIQTKWDIPWGWIEHWDSVEKTLKKEIMEEMWLKVTKVSKFPLHFTLAESANGTTPLWLLYYEVEVENFHYTPSNECRELKFFSIEEVLNEELWSAVRITLEEMRETQKQEA